MKKTKKATNKIIGKTVRKTTKKEQLIGKIIHYYDHIEVGIIELNKGSLKVGDQIHIKGHVTDFEQDVKSMQIEHEQIQKAKKGDIVGLKAKEKTKEGDLVYRV